MVQHRRSGRPRTPLGVPTSSVDIGQEHRLRALDIGQEHRLRMHSASSQHRIGAAASVLPLRGGSGGSISQMLDAGGNAVAETTPVVLAIAAMALIVRLRRAAFTRNAPEAGQAKKLADRKGPLGQRAALALFAAAAVALPRIIRADAAGMVTIVVAVFVGAFIGQEDVLALLGNDDALRTPLLASAASLAVCVLLPRTLSSLRAHGKTAAASAAGKAAAAAASISRVPAKAPSRSTQAGKPSLRTGASAATSTVAAAAAAAAAAATVPTAGTVCSMQMSAQALAGLGIGCSSGSRLAPGTPANLLAIVMPLLAAASASTRPADLALALWSTAGASFAAALSLSLAPSAFVPFATATLGSLFSLVSAKLLLPNAGGYGLVAAHALALFLGSLSAPARPAADTPGFRLPRALSSHSATPWALALLTAIAGGLFGGPLGISLAASAFALSAGAGAAAQASLLSLLSLAAALCTLGGVFPTTAAPMHLALAAPSALVLLLLNHFGRITSAIARLVPGLQPRMAALFRPLADFPMMIAAASIAFAAAAASALSLLALAAAALIASIGDALIGRFLRAANSCDSRGDNGCTSTCHLLLGYALCLHRGESCASAKGAWTAPLILSSAGAAVVATLAVLVARAAPLESAANDADALERGAQPPSASGEAELKTQPPKLAAQPTPAYPSRPSLPQPVAPPLKPPLAPPFMPPLATPLAPPLAPRAEQQPVQRAEQKPPPPAEPFAKPIPAKEAKAQPDSPERLQLGNYVVGPKPSRRSSTIEQDERRDDDDDDDDDDYDDDDDDDDDESETISKSKHDDDDGDDDEVDDDDDDDDDDGDDDDVEGAGGADDVGADHSRLGAAADADAGAAADSATAGQIGASAAEADADAAAKATERRQPVADGPVKTGLLKVHASAGEKQLRSGAVQSRDSAREAAPAQALDSKPPPDADAPAGEQTFGSASSGESAAGPVAVDDADAKGMDGAEDDVCDDEELEDEEWEEDELEGEDDWGEEGEEDWEEDGEEAWGEEEEDALDEEDEEDEIDGAGEE